MVTSDILCLSHNGGTGVGQKPGVWSGSLVRPGAGWGSHGAAPRSAGQLEAVGLSEGEAEGRVETCRGVCPSRVATRTSAHGLVTCQHRADRPSPGGKAWGLGFE